MAKKIVIIILHCLFLLISCSHSSNHITNAELRQDLNKLLCVDLQPYEVKNIVGRDGQFIDCIITVTDETVTIAVAVPINLKIVGNKYDFWDEVDSEHMLITNATDGIQTSKNGKTSWSYHPNSGLRIIVER